MANPAITSKGTATRQAILATAREVLIAEGYEKLVLRNIAQRCEIKLGNLQYYFATREDLLTTLIEAEAEQDIATIQATLAAADDRAALRTAIFELLDRWRGESGIVFATMNLLMQHNSTYRALYLRIYENFYRSLEQAIQCALPDIDAEECALRARLLSALVDGAAMQTGISKHATWCERLVDEACRMTLAPDQPGN